MIARVKLASAKHRRCNVGSALRYDDSILEKLETKVIGTDLHHEIFEPVSRRTGIPLDDSQVRQRTKIDLLRIVLIPGINNWKETHMRYNESKFLKINRRAFIEQA